MEELETVRQYYENTCRKMPLDLQRGNGLTRHFNVFVRSNCFKTLPFRRRDYYKISLVRGKAVLYTEKGEMTINKPALLFSSPYVKFGWRNISDEQTGYVCVFNEIFVTQDIRAELKRLIQLFENDIYSLVELTDQQYGLFSTYFATMSEEYKDCFEYKDEIIQHLMKVIILTAMKIRQSLSPVPKVEKQDMLVGRFLDLLDSQFPIDSPRHSIKMKAPADFALNLNIHINHLNHIIKTNTGKTTGQLIAEKKIAEALSLLKNTEWTIAEIGASLGFEYPQYFNLFFRRQTGKSPKAYRALFLANV
ncbi:MAG TPA: AraC family transcriptional regulator [Arachidicoccus sp.]|nr:AraC family transcriptional regulator [Arachidicoccus sp.]